MQASWLCSHATNQANLWTLCGHVSWGCQSRISMTRCSWCPSGRNSCPSLARTPHVSMHDVCIDSCWGSTASACLHGSSEDCVHWKYTQSMDSSLSTRQTIQNKQQSRHMFLSQLTIIHVFHTFHDYYHSTTWLTANNLPPGARSWETLALTLSLEWHVG